MSAITLIHVLIIWAGENGVPTFVINITIWNPLDNQPVATAKNVVVELYHYILQDSRFFVCDKFDSFLFCT